MLRTEPGVSSDLGQHRRTKSFPTGWPITGLSTCFFFFSPFRVRHGKIVEQWWAKGIQVEVVSRNPLPIMWLVMHLKQIFWNTSFSLSQHSWLLTIHSVPLLYVLYITVTFNFILLSPTNIQRSLLKSNSVKCIHFLPVLEWVLHD